MSFGGGSSRPKYPPIVSPAPVRVEPEVTKAKADLKQRLRKAQSRALSQQTTPGLLAFSAPSARPVLSDLL